MTTRGVAHHQSRTRIADQDALDRSRRAARFAANDAAYRAALAVPHGVKLPSTIGCATSSGGGWESCHGGGRKRRSATNEHD